MPSVVHVPTFPLPTVGGLHRAPGLVQTRPCSRGLKEHDCPRAVGEETAKTAPRARNASAGRVGVCFIETPRGIHGLHAEANTRPYTTAFALQWRIVLARLCCPSYDHPPDPFGLGPLSNPSVRGSSENMAHHPSGALNGLLSYSCRSDSIGSTREARSAGT